MDISNEAQISSVNQPNGWLTVLHHWFSHHSPYESVSQWIALIPLVIHLATPKGDHTLVGELALAGKLTMSLFPKLGHLRGISRLLSEIPDFLDRASSKSDLSSTIWDVDWASSFLCANGAARDCLTKFALRHTTDVRDIEPLLSDTSAPPQRPQTPERHTSDASVQVPLEPIDRKGKGKGSLRRYQTLHVIQIKRIQEHQVKQHRSTWKSIGRWTHIPLLLILCVGLFIIGTYGAAANVLLCVATQLACGYVPIGRPQGYLLNTERYEYACMLSAIHSNASNWYLYMGDRPSIDWLLNKTMISVDMEHAPFWVYAFRIAHWIELLAMTYVAGQANWDGVFLLVLVLLNLVFKLIWEYPSHWAALRWISETNVEVKAHSFKLTGRVPMLGAVQLLSATQRRKHGSTIEDNMDWMDDILHPSPRRQTLIDKLERLVTEPELDFDSDSDSDSDSESDPDPGSSTHLSTDDRHWVKQNYDWARQTFRHIQEDLQI